MFKATIPYNYNQHECVNYYLAQYIPANHPTDGVSESLLLFKNKERPDFSAWIDFARQEIRSVKWPKTGLVIRAWHSYENRDILFRQKPLDYLSNALAEELRWKYQPDLIQKLWRTEKSHYQYSKGQRKEQLRDIYILNDKATYVSNTPVLIVDDILTTGTTMASILNAFTGHCAPKKLTTFTLAHTGYDPDFNKQLRLRTKRYSFRPGRGWIDHERR